MGEHDTEEKNTGEDQSDSEGRGFKVEDRRRFKASGAPRAAGDEDESHDRGEQDRQGKPAEASAPAGRGEPGGASEPAGQRGSAEGSESTGGRTPVGFSGFVVGLAQQAFMLLGASPDPNTGVVHKELDQAVAMIDIIAMLKEKTAGNLTEDEARLVEEVLYELRLRYVAETRSATTDSGDHS